MMTVTYAGCQIKAVLAECHYAECRYAECRGTNVAVSHFYSCLIYTDKDGACPSRALNVMWAPLSYAPALPVNIRLMWNIRTQFITIRNKLRP
jgi:hypothetical protein